MPRKSSKKTKSKSSSQTAPASAEEKTPKKAPSGEPTIDSYFSKKNTKKSAMKEEPSECVITSETVIVNEEESANRSPYSDHEYAKSQLVLEDDITELSKPNLQTATTANKNKSKKSSKKPVKSADKPKSEASETPKPKQQLIDFFPVRKSGRRTAKQLKREGCQLLKERVLSECEDGLVIKMYPGKGRGIEAAKYFLRGDFVVEYAGELLEAKEAHSRELEYKKDSTVGSYMYFFSHKDKTYCIDATLESGKLGRLLNHSRLQPNCTTKTIEIDDKPRLVIIALRDIEPGEEMLYDYGDRNKEAIQENPWLLL